MTQGHITASSARAVKLSIAGLTVLGAALAGAAPAAAEPAAPSPTPIPSDPAVAGPGQLVVSSGDPAAPPAPPSVPEIANPVYGSGENGSGVLGTLKDLWHQARDPYYAPEEASGASPNTLAPPPPGAGAAPPLPPGYVSLNAPGSETASTSTGADGGAATGGPALPPGYYPLTGPPPPGYEFTTPGQPDPAAAPTTPTP